MPTHPPLYPLRFAPIFKSAIWGGRRIADYFPNAPKEGPISEVWLVSDVANNASVVADGELAGTSLRELMQTRSVELGLERHDTFPLLIKIIDAREPLSVQVHPNDEQAQRLAGQPRGKTEAWYILHSEPEARVYAGFKPGVDRAAFLEALHACKIEDTLHSFVARAGDCVFLPAGTIHAAGAGLTIFEVQQTSDITYRLHDWGRVDTNTGQPRELHVDKAIECLNYDLGPVGAATPIEEPMGRISLSKDYSRLRYEAWTNILANNDYFSLRTTIVNNIPFVLEPQARCRILVGLSGTAEISSENWKGEMHPNEVFLVPASTNVWIDPNGKVSLLDVRPS